MKNILGNKGAGLAEMSNLKLPIPDGFTITTELCNYFYTHNNNFLKIFCNYQEQIGVTELVFQVPGLSLTGL
ncbi:MAG: hypothetical protein O7C59_04210 [Rickettsia endosymbiont of Ixodes persulcatus]|nr:hypothetical protein [Rickettsia endosymbiont of Ixodes persulcatus]